MLRLLGKFCILQALFLLPMSVHILSDALSVNGTEAPATGAWIFFSGISLLMVASGWFGLKFVRR